MKIGILTQPLHNNYGGLLQNFALQQALRDKGHEPITLDWNTKKVSYLKRMVCDVKLWLMWKLHRVPKPLYQPTADEIKTISRNTARFVAKYINHTEKFRSSDEFLKEVKSKELEVLIAGSDQVWRPIYSGGHIFDMFFLFAEKLNLKRIAYAASFGTEQWEFTENQTTICSRLAQMFNLISVREESGVFLCKNNLGVDAIHVLDPTMLHDRSVYEKIVTDNNTPKSPGNLFHYILDPSKEKIEFIESVAKSRGFIPFTIMPTYQAENRTKENVKNEIEKCVFPDVEKWLRAFMDSEMVICDSFHGCVFAIIFNKPFWVLGNESRGNARFDSLLKTFGLQERLISTTSQINIDTVVDWAKVNKILAEKSDFSKNLLLNALK